MNRTLTQMIQTFACSSAMAMVFSGATAQAQQFIPQPVVVQQDPGGYPPPEYVATTQPVYFEGHPAYFWNGRWYYRQSNGWGFYHEEPVFLHNWRAHNPPPPPRYYEGHYGAHEFHRR